MKDCKHLITLFPQGQNLEVIEQFDEHGHSSISGGGNTSSKAFLLADIIRENKHVDRILWICSDSQHREFVARSLFLWGDSFVHDFFQEENYLMDKKMQRRNAIKALETIALIEDENSEDRFFTMTYKDLFLKYPNPAEVKEKTIVFSKGQKCDSMEIFESLIEVGYEVADDIYLEKGEYYRHGDSLILWPANHTKPVRISLAFDEIEAINYFDLGEKNNLEDLEEVKVFPVNVKDKTFSLLSYFKKGSLIVEDELELTDEDALIFEELMSERDPQARFIEFKSFMEETNYHHHLHYLSVLKYHNALDFVADMSEKMLREWRVLLFTKHPEQYEALFAEKNLPHSRWIQGENKGPRHVLIFPLEKEAVFPDSFQNPALKLLVLSDRSVSGFSDIEEKSTARQKVNLDFLTGLKVGDYVVHTDHGIGLFLGLDKRTIDEVTREYLKIGYAENDKLFVPIDQADKVSKYIGAGDRVPRLTRLGSAEWSTMQSRVRKETEKIAQELLQLYAERENAKGHAFSQDGADMKKFEELFAYNETPGQHRAILDVKSDMEKKKPMDRLVCGDVGFGKTEVAMRAAFKAVQDGKQVAVLAPITILVDQHYKSFVQRMEEFNVRIEMLSRFRSGAEQTQILKKLEKGEIDIIVGTHRILQKDIKFKDLGLVIIDEEQRFGVKQKERLKEIRSSVDLLTLTATPIPRTLNISLHGLRDISTITTPPPARLPIVTEVRRFSLALIKTVIEKELERKGQIYFLHNRVQTIEDMAERLRTLIPKARIVVTHGQLKPEELEKRILAFKQGEFDVLVSSTIIENGIDLPNANTLVVNQAEKFGLAQLYQLRGRVGRGKTQAYSYFLYHMKRLPLDAKKRLRAIVEASELGAGFQIAMKDLEIRGAGDVLGANQSGAINVVGVSHFIRMLNQAVEDLKKGRKSSKSQDAPDVTIEVPLPAYIPEEYILSSKEKIAVYQKLAAADTEDYLNELQTEIVEEHGHMPDEVANLFKVLEIKILAKKAKIQNVKAENLHSNEGRQIVLHMTESVRPANIMNLLEQNAKWIISGSKLKISFQDLGPHWVSELKTSLKALGKTLKNLPGAEVE